MNNFTPNPVSFHLAALLLAVIELTASAHAKEPQSLVLYRIGEVPVEIRKGDAYAVMLVNDGGKEDPSPRYILAIAKPRTVVDTKDIELFKSLLKRIPRGSRILQYGSCTVPRSWGLKEDQYKAYHNVFKELGLTL